MYEDDVNGYNNNHGGGDMLVYYSLGNFVNWTSGSGKGVANRMVGGMAEISIKNDTKGETAINNFGVEALVCHVKSGNKNIKVYPLSKYSEELGKENEIINQDSSFSTQYCIDFCNKIWNKNWH